MLQVSLAATKTVAAPLLAELPGHHCSTGVVPTLREAVVAGFARSDCSFSAEGRS